MLVDSPTADRITGVFLLLLGIAMLAGGYTMDRLEIRQIHPSSIPGLVPMGLGLAMIVCALLLINSSRTAPEINPQHDKQDAAKGSYRDLLLTLVLSLGYGAGLIGTLHFSVATGCYLFLFTLCFTWPEAAAGLMVKLKIIAYCALFSVVFSTAISLLFRYAFLVRLP